MQEKFFEKAMSADRIIKCEELWYEDGNLVIQTKNTLFKVHRSVLCQNLSVFTDIFAGPRPIQSENYFEGSLVLPFHDDVEEMAYFLQAIYKSSTFSNLLTSTASKPTFEQVIALARLGTKYNVPHIRRFALRLLRLNLPLSVRDLVATPSEEHWTFTTTFPAATMITEVIELAHQLDAPDLLPAAFAMASCLETRFLLAPGIGGLLTDEARSSCLHAHEQLLVLQSAIVAYFATATCLSSSSVCGNTICRHLRHLLDQNSRYTPFSFRSLNQACKTCNFNLQEKIMQTRLLFWDEIPTIFNLPSWDVLRAKREEDESTMAITDSEASSISLETT